MINHFNKFAFYPVKSTLACIAKGNVQQVYYLFLVLLVVASKSPYQQHKATQIEKNHPVPHKLQDLYVWTY